MTNDDRVATSDVMRVLATNGVAVSSEGNTYTLSKGDVVEVQVLGQFCGRRMIQRFARIFDVGIHLLWNPEFPELTGYPRPVKKSE